MEKHVTMTSDAVMTNINKKIGVDVITKAEDDCRSTPKIPFGVFVATYGSGGGAPVWQMSRLRGAEGSGKSTMALSMVKQAALLCWRCFNLADFCTCSESPLRMKSLYVDAEGALDPEWIDAIGVPRDSFYILRTVEGVEALESTRSMLQADDMGLIIVDSLAHLLPPVELDRPIGDRRVASLASLLADAVVKLQVRLNTEKSRGHPCLVVATNQLRFIIGGPMYANPETESGGQALKHWFSLGIRLSKLATVEKDLTSAGKAEVKLFQKHGVRWDKERMSTFLGVAEFMRARENIYDKNDPTRLLYRKGAVIDDQVIEKYLKQYGFLKNGWSIPGLYDDVRLQKELREKLRENDNKYYQLHIELTRRAKEHGITDVQSVRGSDVADPEGDELFI